VPFHALKNNVRALRAPCAAVPLESRKRRTLSRFVEREQVLAKLERWLKSK
jgi:hypothetical protein